MSSQVCTPLSLTCRVSLSIMPIAGAQWTSSIMKLHHVVDRCEKHPHRTTKMTRIREPFSPRATADTFRSPRNLFCPNRPHVLATVVWATQVAGIIDSCPQERRQDLVFMQSGCLEPLLKSRGLCRPEQTQATLFFDIKQVSTDKRIEPVVCSHREAY